MSLIDPLCIGQLEIGTRVRVLTALAERKNPRRRSQSGGKQSSRHKAFTDSQGIFSGVVLKATEIVLKRDETDSTHKQNQVLALSLSKNSPPFSAGQVVWIREEKIKAITLIDD